MSDQIIEQLKRDGIKYVRWAYSGSNDDGYIVEIKTFDSAERENGNVDVYNCSPEGESTDYRVLKYGLEIFDGLKGFEINDGGYGWILLNTDSGECILSEHWNELGIEGEYFPDDEFDRVEFKYNDDWDPANSDASAIDVILYNEKLQNSFIINEEQKCKFISFDRVEGKKKKKDFFERGGHVLCTVNGVQLRDFLSSIGFISSPEYYFRSDEVASRSQNDILTEITFSVSDPWDGHYLTVFTGGWSDSFRYNAMYESDVVRRNPTPSELERGLE